MTHSFNFTTDALLTLRRSLRRSLRSELNVFLGEISEGYDSSVLNYTFDRLVDLQESYYSIESLLVNIYFDKSLFDEIFSIKQYLRK